VWSSPIRVLGDLIRDGLGRFNFASDDGRVFALSGTGALVAHVPGRVPFSVLPVALADGGIAAGRQDGSVLISRGFKTKRVELGAVPVSDCRIRRDTILPALLRSRRASSLAAAMRSSSMSRVVRMASG
jgi:hypothetical protein